MGLVFFFIASAAVFFKEDDPHSIIIEFFGREHCLDRPFEMDRFTVDILGFVERIV